MKDQRHDACSIWPSQGHRTDARIAAKHQGQGLRVLTSLLFFSATEVTISEIMSWASLGWFAGSWVHKCTFHRHLPRRRISPALFLLSLVFFRFDDVVDFSSVRLDAGYLSARILWRSLTFSLASSSSFWRVVIQCRTRAISWEASDGTMIVNGYCNSFQWVAC